jgi:hypothetical protein
LVSEFPEWTVEKISKKVGISQRHVTSVDETAGDMAVKAAENLFKEWDINRSYVDFVLLCTQSPDYFLPSTACVIQHALGIPTTCGAFDINLGCSGYEYGLAIAKGSTSTLGTVKVTNGNGLSIDNTGTISMTTATPSSSRVGGTAGAMSAEDKENLNNLASSTTVGKNGITVTKTGNETDITADIDITKGLVFTGNTEGSKQIGVNAGDGIEFSSGAVTAKANSVKGIAVSGSGIGINLKATDSGLAFNTGTGGDNGLYVDALTTQEIEAMWTSST